MRHTRAIAQVLVVTDKPEALPLASAVDVGISWVSIPADVLTSAASSEVSADAVLIEVASVPPVRELHVLQTVSRAMPNVPRVAVLDGRYTFILDELYRSGATAFVFGKLPTVLTELLHLMWHAHKRDPAGQIRGYCRSTTDSPR